MASFEIQMVNGETAHVTYRKGGTWIVQDAKQSVWNDRGQISIYNA